MEPFEGHDCDIAQFDGHDFEYRTEDDMSDDDLKSMDGHDYDITQFGHDFDYRTEDEMSEDDIRSTASKDDFSCTTDDKCSMKVRKFSSWYHTFASQMLCFRRPMFLITEIPCGHCAGQGWEP